MDVPTTLVTISLHETPLDVEDCQPSRKLTGEFYMTIDFPTYAIHGIPERGRRLGLTQDRNMTTHLHSIVSFELTHPEGHAEAYYLTIYFQAGMSSS